MDIATISIISTTIISISSFFLNYLLYVRETPSIKVSGFIGRQLMSPHEATHNPLLLYIGVINTRRGVAVLKSITFRKEWFFKRTAAKYFPAFFKLQTAMLTSPEFSKILYEIRDGGTFARKLMENDEVSVAIELAPDSLQSLSELFKSYSYLCLEDSAGRIYKLPWYMYKKIREDLKEEAALIANV